MVTSSRGSDGAPANARAELAAEFLRGTGVEIGAAGDAQRLETVDEESLGFLVVDHFLDHSDSPIEAIGTHLRKLRPGGVLLYAVSDKPDALKLFTRCHDQCDSFDIQAIRRSGREHIVVLRKRGTLVAPAGRTIERAYPRVPRAGDVRRQESRCRRSESGSTVNRRAGTGR